MEQFTQLMIKIEELRNEMHNLAMGKGLNHKEVVSLSQRLDCLLNEYYKRKNPAYDSVNPEYEHAKKALFN